MEKSPVFICKTRYTCLPTVDMSPHSGEKARKSKYYQPSVPMKPPVLSVLSSQCSYESAQWRKGPEDSSGKFPRTLCTFI